MWDQQSRPIFDILSVLAVVACRMNIKDKNGFRVKTALIKNLEEEAFSDDQIRYSDDLIGSFKIVSKLRSTFGHFWKCLITSNVWKSVAINKNVPTSLITYDNHWKSPGELQNV